MKVEVVMRVLMPCRRTDGTSAVGGSAPRRPQQFQKMSPSVKNVTRTIIGGVCLIVVTVAAVPTSLSACWPKECSLSTATPFILVLKQDPFTGRGQQVTGEPAKKRGDVTHDDMLYIERRHHKIDGMIQERYQVRSEDWSADVKTWVDEWFEQNKTSNNSRP